MSSSLAIVTEQGEALLPSGFFAGKFLGVLFVPVANEDPSV